MTPLMRLGVWESHSRPDVTRQERPARRPLLADRILSALRAAGPAGLAKRALFEVAGRHVPAQRLSGTLNSLAVAGLARLLPKQTAGPSGGRPEERWAAVEGRT